MFTFLLRAIHFIPYCISKFETFILKKRLHINNTIKLMPYIKISNYKKLIISDYVYIGPGTTINAQGGVKIGRGTLIAPNVNIYSASHKFIDAEAIPFDEVVINDGIKISENVWIGANAMILPGTQRGEGCIIGAGAVIRGVIKKYSVVIGNPAKVVGHINEDDYLRLKREDKIFLKLRQERMLKLNNSNIIFNN
jgi:acetyltransferase-like isoleucine patch superfamily enzyme